jgi:hypothetical protein
MPVPYDPTSVTVPVMPIDATCPACQKRYRLKDELGGKSVKCSNPDCRKPFPVPAVAAAANGKPAAKPAAKPKPKTKKELEAEAERLASELFNEKQEDTKATKEKTVAVECLMCNHKWTEPESKAGKNVICPECKSRVKVPELVKKKVGDWRDATGGRRLMEKGPELPKDLAEQQMQDVSIQAMQDAGAIEAPEVEPRPLREYILMALVPLVVIGLGVGAVVWWMKSSAQGQENEAMAVAMKELEELKADDSPIPKDDRRLMRAGVYIAQGEYSARLNTKEGIKEAVKVFAAARRELEAAPKTQFERDALFADLAVAQLALGGTDEQANTEVRLRWSPAGAKVAPVGGGTVVDYVQNELRQTLTKFTEKEVDKGVRLSAVVRLTRGLCKPGKPEILFEIVTQGFAPEDALEAQSLVLLVALREGTPEDKVKRLAEVIRDQLKADDKMPCPWPVVALFSKLGITDYDTKPKIAPPVGDGFNVSLATRMAYSVLYLTQDKVPEAVKLASSPPGTANERFPAMAILAELMADPKPLLDEAAKAKDVQPGNRLHLYRLTRVAAEAGATERADGFAKGIADEGLREWATAEALRGKWAASKASASANDLTLPTEPAKLKAGQAWAALLFARHNARTTGDRAAGKQYDEWADRKLRGFGYAGMALGFQDTK